jgi:drug/metabolite transporter (DMT)-like permease
VYGERLSAVEIFGGALLVSGSWFIIRLRLRASA